MSARLVSIRGPLGAGKTTAAQYLGYRWGYKKVSFADPLKLEVFAALYARSLYISYISRHRISSPADAAALVELNNFPGDLQHLPDPPSLGFRLDSDKIKWVNQHKAELRGLLQWWGTELRRGSDEVYWVRQWTAIVAPLLVDGIAVVVDDARFENEIDLINALGGQQLVLDTAPSVISPRLIARDGAVVVGLTSHASEQVIRRDNDINISNDADVPALQQCIVDALGLYD